MKIDISNDVISLSQPAYFSSLLKNTTCMNANQNLPAYDLFNENDSTKCDNFREAVGATTIARSRRSVHARYPIFPRSSHYSRLRVSAAS